MGYSLFLTGLNILLSTYTNVQTCYKKVSTQALPTL